MINKLRLAFMASGSGTNFQSIIDAIKNGSLNADPILLISNNSKAFALERAKNEGLQSYHISSIKYPNEKELNEKLLSIFYKNNINLIVLAGYMKKIDISIINEFDNRITNIHPALLPKYGGKGMYGMNVHKAVIDAGETESGATVHLVNSEFDKGQILAQKKVAIEKDDTPETLAAKVLTIEHKLYPETLQNIAIGKIKI